MLLFRTVTLLINVEQKSFQRWKPRPIAENLKDFITLKNKNELTVIG